MAKAKQQRRRSSDYAARLSARRKDAVNAYFKALGGPKGDDARMKAIAEDAQVKASTFKTYLSGKSDMGRQACERLQAKLAAQGKVLSDFSNDAHVMKNGIWIFANPKRKVPFLPQRVREKRAEKVLALMREIVEAIGKKAKGDEQVYSVIAEIVGLKSNSILMVANSCSYLADNRLKMLEETLRKKGKALDLSLLGEDPRNLDDENGDAGEVEDDEDDSGTPKIQEVAGVLATLGENDVLMITGNGAHEIFNQDSAAVIVVRPGAQIAIHSVPAGCLVDKGTIMNASDGSGVVSIPFKPGD